MSDTTISWQCSFDEVDGAAVLDSDRFRLVFSGVKLESSPLNEGGGASFSIRVAGSGTEDVSVVAHKTKLVASYRNAGSTITVGSNGTVFKVIDYGKQLQFGDDLFPINDKKLTLVMDAKGTVTRDAHNR